MSGMTAAQLDTFSEEIEQNARKMQDNAFRLADTSRLINSAIHCGDVAEQLSASVNSVVDSLEEVSSNMSKIGMQVREVADMQKNRELLGL